MAVLSNFLKPAKLVTVQDVGLFDLITRVTFPATGIGNGDNVQLLTVPCNLRLTSAILGVLATLGASATVKLQLNRGGVRSDLTVATTAGGPSLGTSNSIGPKDLLTGDIIEILTAGAAPSASADIVVDMIVQRA